MSGTYTRYAELLPGRCFPEAPHRYAVTAEAVARYRAIFAGAPGGEADPLQPVPPTFAAVYFRGAKDAVNGPPGGVHVKQSFVFHRPVVIGDVIDTTMTVRERYERNGRPCVTFDIHCRDLNGDLVTSGAMVQIWGQE